MNYDNLKTCCVFVTTCTRRWTSINRRHCKNATLHRCPGSVIYLHGVHFCNSMQCTIKYCLYSYCAVFAMPCVCGTTTQNSRLSSENWSKGNWSMYIVLFVLIWRRIKDCWATWAIIEKGRKSDHSNIKCKIHYCNSRISPYLNRYSARVEIETETETDRKRFLIVRSRSALLAIRLTYLFFAVASLLGAVFILWWLNFNK